MWLWVSGTWNFHFWRLTLNPSKVTFRFSSQTWRCMLFFHFHRCPLTTKTCFETTLRLESIYLLSFVSGSDLIFCSWTNLKAQFLNLIEYTTTILTNAPIKNLVSSTEATKDLGRNWRSCAYLSLLSGSDIFVSAGLSDQANTLASNRRRSSVSHQGFVENECAVMGILGKSSFSESILPHIGTAIH